MAGEGGAGLVLGRAGREWPAVGLSGSLLTSLAAVYE